MKSLSTLSIFLVLFLKFQCFFDVILSSKAKFVISPFPELWKPWKISNKPKNFWFVDKRIIKKIEVFFWLPIEELIKSRQQEYYDSLAQADKDADSAVFAELMLEIIRDTLSEVEVIHEQTGLPKELSDKCCFSLSPANNHTWNTFFPILIRMQELAKTLPEYSI